MYRIVLITLLSLLLAACADRPSEADITTQVTDDLLSGGRDRVYEVRNLTKVNGIPRDKNSYSIEVSYDLYFKMDLERAVAELQRETGSIFAAGAAAFSLGVEYGDFRAGDTLHQEARYRFIRTEKGWRLDRREERS